MKFNCIKLIKVFKTYTAYNANSCFAMKLKIILVWLLNITHLALVTV